MQISVKEPSWSRFLIALGLREIAVRSVLAVVEEIEAAVEKSRKLESCMVR